MSSLGLVSSAIASAVAIAQPINSNTVAQYESIRHILTAEELASDVDITELTSRVFMAERTLFALYQLASRYNEIFKQSQHIEWMSMFKDSATLLFQSKPYAEEQSELSEILAAFESTLNKITYLFKACEYQKRAEDVLNGRLYTGNPDTGLVFDGRFSREEKRKQLLANRRV